MTMTARMSVSKLLLIAVLSIPLGTGWGCRNYEDRIPVSGTVTLDAVPLKAGFVAFIGEEGYVVASGPIRNGRYELSQNSSRDGIPTGEYGVQFEAWKEAPGQELPQGGFSKGVSALPERYRSSTTSGITASVTKKSRRVDFALTTKEDKS